jgi:hypothetical protein
MLFGLIGSLTSVSYGATVSLGLPHARALRLRALRMALARRAKKAAAAAIPERYRKWIEETVQKAKSVRTWLVQNTLGLCARFSSGTWLKGRWGRRTAAAEAGGEETEPE